MTLVFCSNPALRHAVRQERVLIALERETIVATRWRRSPRHLAIKPASTRITARNLLPRWA
jgi:hypothetical protein